MQIGAGQRAANVAARTSSAAGNAVGGGGKKAALGAPKDYDLDNNMMSDDET